jgi:hypothetical protein
MILNKINKNMVSNIEYTDEEIQNILSYFMVSNSKTDDDTFIQQKMGFLQADSIYYFKAIRTGDKISKEKFFKRYQNELEEIEVLLNISSKDSL